MYLSQFWKPFVIGLSYGILHVVGPDHIGTLISLSIAVKPRTAFALGATWSIGHCAGLALVGVLVFLLQKLVEQKEDLETWEYYGDYFVGASLVLCGVYFLLNKGKYVEQNGDGSISLKGCDCHGAAAPHLAPQSSRLSASYIRTTCDQEASDHGSTICCSPCGEVYGVPSWGLSSKSLDDDTEIGGIGTDVEKNLPKALNACECHGPAAPQLATHFSRPLSQSRRKKKVALCASYTKTDCDHDACDDGSTTCCSSSGEVSEFPREQSLDDAEGGGKGSDVEKGLRLSVYPPASPPGAVQSLEAGPPEQTSSSSSVSSKPILTYWGGILLGIVQGVCCPMGLVGITLLTSMQASKIAFFLVVFFFVSAVGTGAFSYSWSHLVRSNCIPGCSPMRMYEISAWFTSLLGVCWIAANYFGVLNKLNYAE